MWNGIQSSPSFQGSVVLASVPSSTVVLLTVPFEKVVELMVRVKTSVDVYGSAEGEGVMIEVKVVVTTCSEVLFAVAEGEDVSEDALPLDEED